MWCRIQWEFSSKEFHSKLKKGEKKGSSCLYIMGRDDDDDDEPRNPPRRRNFVQFCGHITL